MKKSQVYPLSKWILQKFYRNIPANLTRRFYNNFRNYAVRYRKDVWSTVVEKLSVDFIRKLFTLLTNGNAQIKFHTICMQNRNREKAANQPVAFGLKLLGYNVWYRLPLIRDIPIGRTIGKNYLTHSYLRLPVEDWSSEILENPAAVCDVEQSLLLPVLSPESFFKKLEEMLDFRGFAAVRSRYQDCQMPLEEIYHQINRELSTHFSWKQELTLARTYLIPNRYLIRLLDIAAYHGVQIHLVMDSSYPRTFFEEILRQNEIAWDTLSVSCETGQTKVDAAQSLGLERFGVVSADFKGFLRPLEKHGARPIYYRAPVQLMQDALHPGISNDFKERYDAICGARVFSGRKRPSFLYELGCLCAGPLLYSLYSFFDADFTICYAARHSCFAKMTHPHTVCTMNPQRRFHQTSIQVLDPGFDPEGFSAFMDELRRNHPHTTFRTLSLREITARDPSVLSSLFTGKKSDLNDGIRDFCRDFAKYTDGDPISIQDGVRLFRAGLSNLETLSRPSVCTAAVQPVKAV